MWERKKNKLELLEQGSYRKLILRLSLPTVAVMLVTVLYNMADTFFIGQSGNTSQLASVSLCAPVFTVLSGLGTLFGSGGCTSVSLALGRNEPEKARAYTSLCFWGAVLTGLLFAGTLLSAAEPLSRLLGATDDMLQDTCRYLRILGAGAPVILFGNVFANLVRADGSAEQSLTANGLGTAVNIGLDALFILAFGWGVAGAALATVLGNIVCDGYLLLHIARHQKLFSLSPKALCLRREILLPVITLGLPMACGTLLMSLSGMLANRLTMQYGTTALAAQGVSGKIGMLLSMVAMGICMGFQPALSYAFGKGTSAVCACCCEIPGCMSRRWGCCSRRPVFYSATPFWPPS